MLGKKSFQCELVDDKTFFGELFLHGGLWTIQAAVACNSSGVSWHTLMKQMYHWCCTPDSYTWALDFSHVIIHAILRLLRLVVMAGVFWRWWQWRWCRLVECHKMSMPKKRSYAQCAAGKKEKKIYFWGQGLVGYIAALSICGELGPPFLISPPCRQLHSIFGGFYLPFRRMRFVISGAECNPHKTRHSNFFFTVASAFWQVIWMLHSLCIYYYFSSGSFSFSRITFLVHLLLPFIWFFFFQSYHIPCAQGFYKEVHLCFTTRLLSC